MERSCFPLGGRRIETDRVSLLEQSGIVPEWKSHGLGIVKSGKTGIISIVRCKADMIQQPVLDLTNN